MRSLRSESLEWHPPATISTWGPIDWSLIFSPFILPENPLRPVIDFWSLTLSIVKRGSFYLNTSDWSLIFNLSIVWQELLACTLVIDLWSLSRLWNLVSCLIESPSLLLLLNCDFSPRCCSFFPRSLILWNQISLFCCEVQKWFDKLIWICNILRNKSIREVQLGSVEIEAIIPKESIPSFTSLNIFVLN